MAQTIFSPLGTVKESLLLKSSQSLYEWLKWVKIKSILSETGVDTRAGKTANPNQHAENQDQWTGKIQAMKKQYEVNKAIIRKPVRQRPRPGKDQYGTLSMQFALTVQVYVLYLLIWWTCMWKSLGVVVLSGHVCRPHCVLGVVVCCWFQHGYDRINQITQILKVNYLAYLENQAELQSKMQCYLAVLAW